MIFSKFLYNKLFDFSKSKDWYIQEYQAIIDEINALAADNEDAFNADVHVDESFMPDAEFFRYRGKYSLNLLGFWLVAMVLQCLCVILQAW